MICQPVRLPDPELQCKLSTRFDIFFNQKHLAATKHLIIAKEKGRPKGPTMLWCGVEGCKHPFIKSSYDGGFRPYGMKNNDAQSLREHYSENNYCDYRYDQVLRNKVVTEDAIYSALMVEAEDKLNRAAAGLPDAADPFGNLNVATGKNGPTITICPIIRQDAEANMSAMLMNVAHVSAEKEQPRVTELANSSTNASGASNSPPHDKDARELIADAEFARSADVDGGRDAATISENAKETHEDDESTVIVDYDAEDDMPIETCVVKDDECVEPMADGSKRIDSFLADADIETDESLTATEAESSTPVAETGASSCDHGGSTNLFATMVLNANSSKEDEVPENKLPENKTRILRKINNDDMVFHIVAGILLPDYQKKKHEKKYRVADITSGERKYTSKLPKSHFHIEEFDLHKHSGHPSGNYDGVFKPMVLLLRGKFHIVLVDPPYMSAAGGHHLCNCGPGSISFQNHNRKYGVDVQLSRQQIVGLCGRLIETAMRKTVISGYVLIKCQAYRQFPLDAIVMELASKAGGLEYHTKFMLETASTKQTNQENFSTMFVFKRVKRISPKSGLVPNDFLDNGSAGNSIDEIDRLIMLADNEFQEQAKEALDKVAVASNIVLKLCSHLVEECGESEDEVKNFVLEYLNEIAALDHPIGHSFFIRVVHSFDASKAAGMYKAKVKDIMKREEKERLKRKKDEETQLMSNNLACFLKSKKSRTHQ